MSYAIDDGPVELWKPGDEFPLNKVYRIQAFNAEFELNIWNLCCTRLYGWPTLTPDMIECIQAQAAYAGLPRNLGDACDVLGFGKFGKDKEGGKIMKELTKPYRGKVKGCEVVGGKWKDDPEKHAANERYCIQDTVAERAISRLIPPLPAAERQLWLAHQQINARGIPIDVAMCRNAHQIARMAKAELCAELQEVTGLNGEDGQDRIKSPDCVKRLKDWFAEQGFDLPTNDKGKPSMAEEHVKASLADPNTPELVKQALEIRMMYREKAVTKYPAMLNHADEDGRCRNAQVFYKAGTGRFQSPGVNFGNLRQLDEDELEEGLELADSLSSIDNDDDLMGMYEELSADKRGVIPILSGMVRLAVCARPGYELVVCDYSSIEMRVLHWLAGDNRQLKLIKDNDAGVGPEPYKLAAASIFGKPVDEISEAERQFGKVMILGCGYLSGAEKLRGFCAQYGVDISLERSQELVQLYRRSYPQIKRFWYQLGEAATTAVKDKTKTECGPIEFFMRGSTLHAKLPSGRSIQYYQAGVFEGMYGDEVEAVDPKTGNLRPVSLPILVENVDQAVSRDLLADALIMCRDYRLPVVHHVYDEIVIEVPEGDVRSGAMLQAIMTTPPSWARGLPVAAKADHHR